MGLPFILFWVILCVGREELGVKGIGVCVVIWAGLLAGCLFLSISPYVFEALQALLVLPYL